MNDEELRAFLESATVGEDSEQQPEQANHTGVSNDLPLESGDDVSPAKSFDELIAPGGGSDAELTPIVLPGPKSASKRPFTANEPPAKPAAAPPVVPPVVPASTAAAPPVNPVATPTAPAPTPVPAPVVAPAAAAATVGPPTVAMPEVHAEPEADYEKISVIGGEPKRGRVVPWIIVGAGAVIALVAAIFIVGALAGGGNDEPTPTAAPTVPTDEPPSSNPTTQRPSTPATTTPTATPSPTVPQVEVGPTMTMRITQWNTQVELSQKLGLTASYAIPDGVNLTLQTSLIDSLPSTCSKDWGMTRRDDGTFEVFKPAERCEAAPEVYDELWGLMDAMVKSARSL